MQEMLTVPDSSSIDDYLEIGPQLGEGATGKVFKCRIKRKNITYYACKMVPKDFSNKQKWDAISREIQCLLYLQEHQAVTELHGVYEDTQNVYIVMEYCEGGDLFSRIKQRRFYTELEAAQIVKKLASVLEYSQKLGIMHRDLKPENVLIASNLDDTDVKLADFGSACFFSPGEKMKTFVGSSFYMAPSVLDGCYGPEADMWSLGVILYILLCGCPPFFAASKEDVFQKIKQGKIDLKTGCWKYVSEQAKSLVLGLLERSPEKRLSPSEVLEHKWILKHTS